MARIAKKPRSVKGQGKAKAPPRYTIRIDALDRRYAIDKRTGKRVSVFTAEKERAQRKSTAWKLNQKKGIPRHKTQKIPKPDKNRSEAAIRGWETRRRKQITTPKPPSEETLVPPGVVMVPIEDGRWMYRDIEERSAVYPRVAEAAHRAFIKLQHEAYGAELKRLDNLPPSLETPRFDKLYGPGTGAKVYLDQLARAREINDIDRIIQQLLDEGEYKARDLYTLYFSPEVA